MVGFRFPSLGVPRCFRRSFGPAMAALAFVALLPQAWGAGPTFTVGNTSFPSTAVGKSSTQNVTLSVNVAVPITSIAIAPNFTEYTLGAITGCTVDPSGNTTVAAGTVCTIPVTFTPALPGIATAPPPLSRSAPLLVKDIENATPKGYSFALSGSATGAVFAFAPGYLVAEVGNASFVGGVTPGCPGQTDANGDGCPATDALVYPSSMALDPAGNLYISDGPLYVVHRVDAVTGIISIYAGQYKEQGPSGSGGPAASAKFFNPGVIAVDQAGNVYLDDPASGLWEINPASGIATIIGGGGQYSLPEAVAQGKTAAQTYFGYVGAMLVDPAGNIYIALYSTGSVYRIDAVTSLITAVAGDGTETFPAKGVPGVAANAKLGQLQGIAMDSKGNLYVADGGNDVIFKIDTTGNISIYAGIQATNAQFNEDCYYDTGNWGPATSAFLGTPDAIAFDTADNLYIGEPGSQGGQSCPIRRVDAATGTIHIVAGDTTGSYAFLNNVGATETYLSPNLVVVDGGGDIYVGQAEISSGVSKILPSQSAIIFPEQSEYVTSDLLVTATNVGIGTSLGLSNYPFPIVASMTPSPFTNAPLTGTNPEDCSSGTLAPGAVCGIQVAFYPNSPTLFTATGTDTVEDDSLGVAGTTNVINIKGSAYNGATATLLPSPLTFSAQAVGTATAASSVNFSIFLNLLLTYESTTITGPDASSFQLSATGSNLCTPGSTIASGGGDCNIYVIFNPQAGGPLSATLNATWVIAGVTYNLSAPISGTGLAPTPVAVLSPNPVAFTNQVVATTSAPSVVTLQNTGNATLTGIAPALSGSKPDDFAITTGVNACGSTLAAGDSCSFYVTFTPASAAIFSAVLEVADDAAGTPQSVTLSGAGVSFVSAVGTATSAQAVTVDIGTAGTLNSVRALTMGARTLDFALQPGGTCATATAYTVGQTCTAIVVFTPAYPGSRYGALVLTDASNNVLGTTYLPGTGYGPEMVFEPGVKSTLPQFSGGNYSAPLGVSVDAALNVYVADTLNSRIIQIPRNGAGFGTPVNLPANGLNKPSSVAVDGSGNLFIADTENFRIVELPWNGTSYGTLVTIDASGLPDPAGIAVDGYGNVYFADGLDQKLVEVPWTGNAYGAPVIVTQATGLHSPHGVAVDATGDVFIADSDNGRVVELPWTPTGLGAEVVLATELFYPQSVAVDAAGDVYIANTDAGTVIELPWNGSSFDAPITIPFGILGNTNGLALDAKGNIYVADAYNSDVVELDVSDPPTLNFATTDVGSTSTDSPKTVTVYNIGNGDLYFFAQDNNPVYPVDFPINNNDSNLCEEDNSVEPGSSCDVSVDFVPTAPGGLSEYVVLTDTNLDSEGISQSIPVNGNGLSSINSQTINFTQPASPVIYAPGLSIQLFATGGGSENPIIFTIDPSSTGTGSILGNRLTVTGVGTIVIDANQAGNDSYSPAPQVQRSLVVTQAGQAINFTQPTSPVTYATGLTIALAATGGASGNPVVFTIDESSTAKGSIAGSTLTVTGPGTLVIDANQAGSSDYSAAPQVQRTLVVNKAPQAIDFTQPTSPNTYAASLSVPLAATGGASGNPIVFTLDASSTGAGSISGSTLTATSAGSLVIDANQAGNADYSAAAQVQRTLVVNQAPQAINFTQPTSPVTFTSGLTVSLVASGGASGNPVLFTIDATSTGTGTISGSTLTVTAPGNVVIDANQPGNVDYSAAPEAQRTIVVNPPQSTSSASADFTISASPASQTVAAGAAATYTVTAASTGGSFTSAVTLSVSGAPAGAAANFSPASITPGAAGGNSTLTITPAAGAVAQLRHGFWPLATPVLALLILLPFRRWRRAWKGKVLLMVAGLASLAGALSLMGCGGGFALTAKPQTYTLTITGTSGADTHSTTVQLTVQP